VYSFGYPFPVYPNTECSGSEVYPNIRVTRYVFNIRVPPIYSGQLSPNIRSDTECQILFLSMFLMNKLVMYPMMIIAFLCSVSYLNVPLNIRYIFSGQLYLVNCNVVNYSC
jgi:hypothetical protein